MRIRRTGQERKHEVEPKLIASTVPNYPIDVRPKKQRTAYEKSYIFRVVLGADEVAKNCAHIHYVEIDMEDFAKIVSVLSDSISNDDKLCNELAKQFNGNITSLERQGKSKSSLGQENSS